jgi:hypothetical protein
MQDAHLQFICQRLDKIEEAIADLRREIREISEQFTSRGAFIDAVLGTSNGMYRLDRQVQELRGRLEQMSGTMATMKWVAPLILSILSLILHAITRIMK